MDLIAFKWWSIAILLAIGLVGGLMPLWIKQVSEFAAHLACAFAGGVLASVSLVHMLSGASGDLKDLGADFAIALSNGRKDAFPMGIALFLIGFVLICTIEVVLHHALGANACDRAGNERGSPEADFLPSEQELEQRSAGNAAGWATLAGLTIHSFFEGVAMGVPTNESQVGALVIAVAVHKGFAAFANASANLPLMKRSKRTVWICVVSWFAFTGPLGMMIGLTLTDSLDSAGVAVVTCLAAGSVLYVGVTEMLLPAFEEARGLCWKLLAAWIGMLAMSLLGVWA